MHTATQKMTVKHEGRIIGVMELSPLGALRYIKEAGILSARLRFDGFWGFQSISGQNSLLCDAEKGRINADKPRASVVRQIKAEITANPTQYIEKDGWVHVDGYAYKLEPLQ